MMTTYREKFANLHQEWANCQNELLLIRLQLNHNSDFKTDLQKEFNRLIRRIDHLEWSWRHLPPDPDSP